DYTEPIPAEQPPVPPPASSESTVSRHTFNYVIIAVAFFALGAILGVIAYDRVSSNTNAQVDAAVNRAVAAVIAAVPQAPQVAAEPTRDPNERFVVDTEGDPSRGPDDAPVTIVEFADFRCSYCARFHAQTLTPLLEAYGDNVRFVYRDYPILGADSVTAALAGECATDQGKFWEFHDLIYGNQQDLTREAFTTYAADLGMDVEAFNACLDADDTTTRVQRDFSAGQELGVSGTPTFFVNGRILVGAQPYDAFAQYIDEELAQAGRTNEEPPA
ncbi:MAG TPA: DsbA family protein, partial [Candidatus Limnocylindrales bacterium]|nr:DsbA family protein [Candidatus Limnocylindrales bacterium]